MGLTLYIGNKNFSSWSMRPWLALEHTGAAFEEVVIGLDLPDTGARIAAASPAGKVPALHDAELVVWESLAICEYVAERFPDANLWPQDRAARAVARAMSSEMHAGYAALRTHCPMSLRRTPSEPGTYELTDAVRSDVDRIVRLWTETRAQFGHGGPFLFGGFGIADAMFAPVVSRFRTYGIALDGEARRYADAVWNDAALQKWVEGARQETLYLGRYEGANAK